MEPAPVPPHERAWRHPSELGPPPHEPTTPSGRVLIVTSAAVGLIIVGVLAIAVTPNRSSAPTAVGSSVSPDRAEGVDVGLAPVDRSALIGGETTPPRTAPDVRLTASMVTPLGDDGMAVTTFDAVTGLGAASTALLPTGQVVEIVVVSIDETAGLAMVSLAEPPPAGGYDVAADPPAPDATVLVQGVDSTVVAMSEVAGLDVAEGTPVLDDRGDLVGLCSDDEHGTEMVSLDGHDTEVSTPPSATSPEPISDDVDATTEPD